MLIEILNPPQINVGIICGKAKGSGHCYKIVSLP
jgi:hypothetical protein